jgi:hypothetical protein
MVMSSRSSDKKAGRCTSSPEYITTTRIDQMMIMQDGKCYYCEVMMLYGHGIERVRTKTAVTIEREDNDNPHTINNCVLACSNCNMIRGHNFTFDEMSIYGRIKGSHKRCSMCKETLIRSEFYKSSTKYDGIKTRCKPCKREMYAQSRRRERLRAVIDEDSDNEIDL